MSWLLYPHTTLLLYLPKNWQYHPTPSLPYLPLLLHLPLHTLTTLPTPSYPPRDHLDTAQSNAPSFSAYSQSRPCGLLRLIPPASPGVAGSRFARLSPNHRAHRPGRPLSPRAIRPDPPPESPARYPIRYARAMRIGAICLRACYEKPDTERNDGTAYAMRLMLLTVLSADA
eukprot:2185726-Rhodomonas_salina.3